MSYLTYHGRPAMVAGYRPQSAPFPVRLVAGTLYLVGLATVLVAAGIGALTHGVPWPDQVPEPDRVRQAIAGLGTGTAVALGTFGVFWCVLARAVSRGRQWSRYTMVAVSLLSIAGILYAVWLGYRADTLAAVAAPVLCLLCLNTQAARCWFRWGSY